MFKLGINVHMDEIHLEIYCFKSQFDDSITFLLVEYQLRNIFCIFGIIRQSWSNYN